MRSKQMKIAIETCERDIQARNPDAAMAYLVLFAERPDFDPKLDILNKAVALVIAHDLKETVKEMGIEYKIRAGDEQ
jgi:hypothetical protein